MSKADMEALFAGLAGEGTTEARNVGFTLESAKAREKLQQFAMAQPENFQLLAIAGLYALGCRHFQLVIDADDFRIEADLPLSREPFLDLWSFVSRGSSEATVIGCRLLAMAILTSVRLDEMEWLIESSDAQGPWQLKASVKRGTLGDLVPVPQNDSQEPQRQPGVMIWAKRKALSQIAVRFVSRWLSGKGQGADESLLLERLFLPKEASLVCNGHALTRLDPPGAGVLAALETGQAPKLVDCPIVHRRERDYSLAVLLCRPDSVADARLPGKSNHIQWIWNGLRMDSTLLGGELANFRAFVWAPELRPDLSFTSLVDNRDKQALERTVRSMARELLDRFTRALTAEIRAQGVPQPAAVADRLSIVRDAITRRIGGNVDWRRLASLNKGLTECPLVTGSAADGVTRWFSLSEIREELLQGRAVAAFEGEYQALELAAWPDRPLVLFSSKAEKEFLAARLRQHSFAEAQAVRQQVATLLRPSAAPEPAGRAEALLCGEAQVAGHQLSWALQEAADGTECGELVVLDARGQGFADRSLALPNGLSAELRAELPRSYEGGLQDRALAQQIRQALLTSVAQRLALRAGAVSRQDYDLAARLLSVPDPLGQIGARDHWLVVTSLDGTRRRLSPNALQGELDANSIPLYVACWPGELPMPASPRLASAPVVLVPPAAEAGLAALMQRPVHSATAFELLEQRKAPDWDETALVWQGALHGPSAHTVSSALAKFTLGIPRHFEKSHRAATVLTFLDGYYLASSSSQTLYPFVRLAVDWREGWPDGEARVRLGGPDSEQVQQILRRACLAVAPNFFAEATAQEIYAANPELVGTLMFDLLSEPDAGETPCLLLANGSKIGLSQVTRREGVVTCFTKPPRLAKSYSPHSVYLPGPMLETISLLSEWDWQLDGQPVKAGAGSTTRTEPGLPPAPVPSPSPPPAPAQKVATSAPAESQDQAPDAANSPAPVRAETSHPASPEPPPLPPPEVAESPLEPVPPMAMIEALTIATEGEGEGLTPAQQLAREYIQMGGSCPLFRAYLLSSQLQAVQSQAILLREEDATPILGAPARDALQQPAGRLLLLSALSSLFHRRRDDGAKKEQSFHETLLSAAQRLPPRQR